MAAIPVVRAIDVGYGNTKFVSQYEPGHEVLCSLFPSIAPNASLGPDLAAGVLQRRNTVVVEVNGVKYEVGKDAKLAQDSSYSRILDSAFSQTDAYLALVRGGLFYMGKPVIDMLVVGLPVNTVENYHTALSQRLVGKHQIPVMARDADQLYVPSGATTDVEVRAVKVVPQPIGALFDFSISNNLFSRLRSQMNLVIDPGYYTLDWVVAQGIKVNGARSGAQPGGMSSVLGAMAESISQRIGVQITDVSAIDDAIRTGQKPRFFGKELDIADQILLGKEKARQFVNVLATKVGNQGVDIDNIIIGGGGAEFFRDVIQEKFPNHSLIMTNDPVFSNVRGFQLAGVQWANQAAYAQRTATV